jgi:putative membrane protein
MIRQYIVIGCAAALAACASSETAMNAMGNSTPVSAAARTASLDYVTKAGASDMFEIQSSQIALQKAQNPEVRSFAQMMIDHHTSTSAQLMSAAKQAGLAPPPAALPADKQQKIAMLRNTPAASFDQTYMREQVAGHTEALALHQSFAQNGEVDPLRQVAHQAVPVVEGHLVQARRIAGQ